LARFARDEVLDTDQFVATMAPLASNEVLQNEIADRLTTEIVDAASESLNSVAGKFTADMFDESFVGSLLGRQAEPLVHRGVKSVLASDAFSTLWTEANREAHRAVVALLTGKAYAGVHIGDEGTVSLSLEPIISEIKGHLVKGGFDFADEIPAVDRSFVLFQSPELVKAQGYVSLLDTTADVLPWLVLFVAVAAIWAAPRDSRRKAFSLVGAGMTIAMALLAVAISIGRSEYLDAMPADVLSPPAAAVLIDAVLDPLGARLWPVAGLGIAVVLLGCLPWLISAARTATQHVRGQGRLRQNDA
jgi:hypothetical protein